MRSGSRGTWDIQGTKELYIGGTPYVTNTAVERIRDTVEFSPQQCQLPSLLSKYLATKSAIEVTDALKNPLVASPFLSPVIKYLQH